MLAKQVASVQVNISSNKTPAAALTDDKTRPPLFDDVALVLRVVVIAAAVFNVTVPPG
jgi:hypothetical protein